ncbi:MAG: glycosyltransferase [Lachnospiraceae bacterium]|nr:glycosyltransferase [Lachnospiraceae bacterium]
MSKKTKKYKYIVLTADGNGSKGDEGLLRGILHLLNYDHILLISPNRRFPCLEGLIDLSSSVDEICADEGNIEAEIVEAACMIVIGADVIDGTHGLEYSIMRLKAINKMISLGGEVHVFASFRADVNHQIIDEIIQMGETVHYHLRDQVSIDNFKMLTNLPCNFFPDLAFYCPIEKSSYTQKTEKIIDSKSHDYKIVGVNFSEHCFRSFFQEETYENRKKYIIDTLLPIKRAIPNVYILLFSNDIREWENHLSDSSYQKMAYKYLKELEIEGMIIDPFVTYPEILSILPHVDYLITARMHLSVAAFRVGLLPIIYTGKGGEGLFSMWDKVCGMSLERVGTTDLVAENENELEKALKLVVKKEKELKQKLTQFNLENQKLEIEYLDKFRVELRVDIENSIYEDEKEILRFATERLRELREEKMKREQSYDNKIASLTNEISKHEEQTLQEIDKIIKLDEKIVKLTDEIIFQEEQFYQEVKKINNRTDELIENFQKQINKQQEQMRKQEQIISEYDNTLKYLESEIRKNPFNFILRILRISNRIIKKFSFRRFKNMFFYLKNEGIKSVIQRSKNCVNNQVIETVSLIEQPLPEIILSLEDCKEIVFPVVKNPLVSIIIPVYNQFTFTYHCLKSIFENSGSVSYEIILADDGSNDLTTQIDKIIKNIKIVRNDKNLRFLKNCNHAAGYANGKYMLFLNNDTQVGVNWLEPLVQLVEKDVTIGLVGSKLVYANGMLQEAGGIVWKDGTGWNYGNGQNPNNPEYNYVKECDYISGAAIMIPKELWTEIGGFDERFIPAYYEDTDLAFEVRKRGKKVVYQPLSVVTHYEGISNGKDTSNGQKKYQIENQKKFFEKWEKVLQVEQSDKETDFIHARERSQRKKSILVIDHYVPNFDKDAGGKCTFMYLKLFVSMGFKVTFIGANYYQDHYYTPILNQLGIEVLYGNWYYENWEGWLKENGDIFDYAYLNRPHIAVDYIDVIKKYSHAKVIYFGHDLHFLREQREYELTGNFASLKSSRSWKKREYALFEKADVIHVVGSFEQEYLQKDFPNKPVRNIPLYIYDEPCKDVTYNYEERQNILYVGGFGHPPNIDAVLWFANEVFPKILKKAPDIKWYVVGSKPPQEILNLNNDNIIIKGFVSDEELAKLYQSCRLAVVPLRYGAGVKGKVVEAAYYQIPLVTTPIGAEGISTKEGAFVVEESADTFAKRVMELYADAEELTKMSEKAKELIKNWFLIEKARDVINQDIKIE